MSLQSFSLVTFQARRFHHATQYSQNRSQLGWKQISVPASPPVRHCYPNSTNPAPAANRYEYLSSIIDRFDQAHRRIFHLGRVKCASFASEENNVQRYCSLGNRVVCGHVVDELIPAPSVIRIPDPLGDSISKAAIPLYDSYTKNLIMSSARDD